MITGTHLIIYSKDPEADKAFFRDVLKFPYIDIGHDWLIFRTPPAELAVHPSGENDKHEVYLTCDDIKEFLSDMSTQKIACSDIQNERWGQLVHLTLPGGGKLGVYQPKHASPQL